MIKSILSSLICLLIIGCSSSTSPQRESCDLQCQMSRSPYPDAEAELMALFMDSTMVAQQSTYLEIELALTAFHAQYANFDTTWWFKPDIENATWINVTQLPFTYPLYVGKLEIGFLNDSIAALVRSGDYHAWDSLNTYYHLDSVQTDSNHSIPAMLYFHPRLDSRHLATEYQPLPGVGQISVMPFSRQVSGILLPWREDDGRICFLADFGWGNCHNGCSMHRYFYFKRADDQNGRPVFSLAGSFQTGDESPMWWDDIGWAEVRWLRF